MQGRFDDSVFRPLYQRNNKRGGLKNLRCFPSCSAEHRVRGFCGRSVVVSFRNENPNSNALSTPSTSPPNSPPTTPSSDDSYSVPRNVTLTNAAGLVFNLLSNNSFEGKNIRAFAEFEEVPVGDFVEAPFDSKKYMVGPVPASWFEERVRTKEASIKPLMEGKIVKTKECTIVFEFNHERRGWHYGWVSNKHVCETKHRLVCRLFEENPLDGSLSMISACGSPEFVLFCRRRRRYIVEPTGKVSEPSKRTRKTPSSTKFVQEIELATAVHRIEASRDMDKSNPEAKRIKTEDLTDATHALLSLAAM